jgi:PilZ domain
MFNYLKNLFKKKQEVPTVQVTGFRDGLLSFRSSDALTLHEMMVETPTPVGTMMTKVDIQSYDPGNKEYLAKVADNDKTLESLDIDLSRIARVQKVLRVSSRDLPAYMGLTEEVALSGLRLSTSGPLQVGQILELTVEFDCHKMGTRKVKAKVEWSAQKADGSSHSGLRFHDLDSITFRKLAQYIQSRRLPNVS